jgi:hypothetical protein
MKKNILFYLAVVMLVSCKFNLLVRKDKVIHNANGYILFTKDELGNFISDYFIPLKKINKSLDPISNLICNQKEVGFKINISTEKRNYYITELSKSFYNNAYDSFHILKLNEFNKMEFGTIHILPASIEYSEKYPNGELETKSFKTRIDTMFVLNNRKIEISFFKGKKIWLLNTFPMAQGTQQ